MGERNRVNRNRLRELLLVSALAFSVSTCTTGDTEPDADAYEYRRQALEQLRTEYDNGEITREEFRQRQEEIEDRTLVD